VRPGPQPPLRRKLTGKARVRNDPGRMGSPQSRGDTERAKDGLRPLNWDLIPQPLPVTDELRETVLSMKLPGE
jgi:hypothetical protein